MLALPPVNDLTKSLVGVWSHDALFSPGAAADEVLVFRSDGTGVAEVYNWTLCSYDTFAWQVESDGTLTIIVLHSFESATISTPSDLRVTRATFRIASEQTPVFGVIDVLHLPIAHWLPDRYGRTKADVATYPFPEFDRTA